MIPQPVRPPAAKMKRCPRLMTLAAQVKKGTDKVADAAKAGARKPVRSERRGKAVKKQRPKTQGGGRASRLLRTGLITAEHWRALPRNGRARPRKRP